MFDFKLWLRTGIINGYKTGDFSMPYVTTMTANYISKGMLTIDDASQIDESCKAWDQEQLAKQQQEEIQNGEEVDPGFTHPEVEEEVTPDG